NFSNVAPMVIIKYQFNHNVNLYATYATGFRAGGFNTTSTSPALLPYGQEDAENFEVGAKTLWAGGRVGLNLALFYMTQSHLVLAQTDPTAPPQFNFTYLSNIGDARTYGVEFESFARITNWLTGAFSVGYLDPRFTAGSSFGRSVAGQLIPFTRRWTINTHLDVDYPVSDGWRLVGNANWRAERGGTLSTADE